MDESDEEIEKENDDEAPSPTATAAEGGRYHSLTDVNADTLHAWVSSG